MAKQKGINARAWFYSQSFHSSVEFVPSPELQKTIGERDAAFAELQEAPEKTQAELEEWTKQQLREGNFI